MFISELLITSESVEHKIVSYALIVWILKSICRDRKELGWWVVTILGIEWKISAIDGEDT